MSLHPSLPSLTQARAELTQAILAVNAEGEQQHLNIPCERALTIYLDKKEIVTLMTLGAHPEWLVLGYLRNQRLVSCPEDLESITVDWSAGDHGAGVAAVKSRPKTSDHPDPTHAGKVNKVAMTITSGCGQGSLYSHLFEELKAMKLPQGVIKRDEIFHIVSAARLQDSTYKSAGSVHSCALFDGTQALLFVEDVGRHNAIDTIAGWLWMNPQLSLNPLFRPIFYTTGRLTSEMILKSAQLSVPIIISRSGITQMGLELALELEMCCLGRALNRSFLCYSAQHRLQMT